jgi:glycosyltransferase involved in cell wall biosynthesis
MPYLRETLASIARQTFKDFCVLAWDNGSTDGSVEELRRWIPGKISGAVVWDESCSNLGTCRARLIGRSATEFCAWSDADDISAPDRFERQLRFLYSNPGIAVVGSQMECIDETGLRTGPYFRLPESHVDIVAGLFTLCSIAQPTVMFRRSAVVAAGNYRETPFPCAEDYDLWLRLAGRFHLANLPDALVLYRVHARNATQSAIRAGVLQNAIEAHFREHARALFGLSADESRRLKLRQSRCALFPLIKMARYLSRTQDQPLAAWLHSPWFLDAAHSFVRSEDFLTRIALAAAEGDGKTARWELAVMARHIAHKYHLKPCVRLLRKRAQ